jgi:hypothetical protein
MPKLTVLFGPQGSGKRSTAQRLAGKSKTYETTFNTSSDAVRMNEVLMHRPEVMIVDEVPLKILDRFVNLANLEVWRIQHPITGMKEIPAPKLIVIIQNSVTAQEVFTVASGRNIELIECTGKEVVNG